MRAKLVQQGAIGKVIQTINIAPHQIFQGHGDAGGSGGRPDWFWDPEQYGGILCDIGSHQVDQFLFYTGSKQAEVVESQIANVRHPDHPQFQDFGDMVLRGDRGFGYVRLDWFTPDGLGTWGDGRLFILGTDGYMEVRKYTDVAVKKQGNNLFVVDSKEARYIDCNNMPLPFGPQFVADIVNRTHTAQDQDAVPACGGVGDQGAEECEVRDTGGIVMENARIGGGTKTVSRRRFLKTTLGTAAAVGFPTIVPSSIFGQYAPSKRINVGRHRRGAHLARPRYAGDFAVR